MTELYPDLVWLLIQAAHNPKEAVYTLINPDVKVDDRVRNAIVWLAECDNDTIECLKDIFANIGLVPELAELLPREVVTQAHKNLKELLNKVREEGATIEAWKRVTNRRVLRPFEWRTA